MYRFSIEDITKCKSIEFKDDTKDDTKLSSNFAFISPTWVDCSTTKERVIISSRNTPNYEDLYNLTNYLFTDTDNLEETSVGQFPYLYSYPETLKIEEKI